LALETKFGTNPYKFGMVGATDSHTGLATAQEDNFFGKHSGYEPDPNRMNHMFMQSDVGTMMSWGRCNARKYMPQRAAASGSVSSADGITRKMIS
jgi:hypothetical protein